MGAAGIGADQRPPAQVAGHLGQGQLFRLDVDDAGHEGESPGRQRQRGTAETHGSPGCEAFLADRLIYQGLLQSQQQRAAR